MGIAGIVAGCCGVAGAVVGMAQVYYTGPIAKKIGMFGADLGFEVSLPEFTRCIFERALLGAALFVMNGS